jgi:hypothetical protein
MPKYSKNEEALLSMLQAKKADNKRLVRVVRHKQEQLNQARATLNKFARRSTARRKRPIARSHRQTASSTPCGRSSTRRTRITNGSRIPDKPVLHHSCFVALRTNPSFFARKAFPRARPGRPRRGTDSDKAVRDPPVTPSCSMALFQKSISSFDAPLLNPST